MEIPSSYGRTFPYCSLSVACISSICIAPNAAPTPRTPSHAIRKSRPKIASESPSQTRCWDVTDILSRRPAGRSVLSSSSLPYHVDRPANAQICEPQDENKDKVEEGDGEHERAGGLGGRRGKDGVEVADEESEREEEGDDRRDKAQDEDRGNRQ